MEKDNINISNKDSKKKKFFTKGFFIGFLITLIVDILIGGLVVLIETSQSGNSVSRDILTIICDAFSVPGILTCMFYLLCYVSDEGAFDIISYSLQLVWHMTFHKNIRETKLPSTYTEYRELKRSKPRVNLLFMLFSGLVFLIIGLILMFIA